MTDQHAPVELILYAEPGGALGARCAEYWAAVSAAGVATTAQEFPPHVSLTGFFHRRPAAVPGVITAFTDAVDVAVPSGLGGARWAPPARLGFQADAEWVGWSVEAAWMRSITAAFVASVAPPGDPAEDELRPKSWLHVSLSYGPQLAPVAAELDRFTALVGGLATESAWTVALMRHDAGTWTRLATAAVTGSPSILGKPNGMG